MISKWGGKISELRDKGLYQDALSEINTFLSDQNLSAKDKNYAILVKAQILIQIQIIRFPFMFNQNYQSSDFAEPLELMENVDTSLSDHIRIGILISKTKIRRFQSETEKQNELFKTLNLEFDKLEDSEFKQYLPKLLLEKAGLMNPREEFDTMSPILNEALILTKELNFRELYAEILHTLVRSSYLGYLNRMEEYAPEIGKIEKLLPEDLEHHYLVFSLIQLMALFNAFVNFSKGSTYNKKINNIFEKSTVTYSKSLKFFYSIYQGHDFSTKGLYSKAINVFDDCLERYENDLAISMKGHVYTYLGRDYLLNSNIIKSLEYLNRALQISKDINDNRLEVWVLYTLSQVAWESRDVTSANGFYQRIEDIYKNIGTQRSFGERVYDLTKALFLKNSERIRDKFLAQKIYEDIVESNEPVFSDFFMSAIINLIDLLFEELLLSGDISILKNIQERLNYLRDYQIKSESLSMEIELNIFQSKIYFIEFEFHKAEIELINARNIAEDYKLGRYIDIINGQSITLKTEAQRLVSLGSNQDLTITEIMEITKTDRLLDELVKHRYNRDKEDVNDYLNVALNIVEEVS